MDQLSIFQLSVALGIISWSFVAYKYIWPKIKGMSLVKASESLLTVHIFRYIGLAFLVPGFVGVDLPYEFSIGAAIGDITAASLAWLCLASTQSKNFKTFLWIFNIVGLLDLLHAFYEGRIVLNITPGDFGGAYFFPILFVPFLIVTHIVIFLLLMRKKS